VIAGTSCAGLQHIRPGAEKPETLTTLSGELELGHVEPQLLPGGAILFVIKDPSRREDHNQVAVYHPDTGKVSRILSGVSSPRYVPDGYLLFARGRTLRAAPFDAEHLQVTGDETSLTDDLSPANSHWFYSPAGFDVAPQGRSPMCPRHRPWDPDWPSWTGRGGRKPCLQGSNPAHRWRPRRTADASRFN
jgi:hypothetical protein